MKLIIDTDARTVTDSSGQMHDLFSAETYASLCRLWVDVGWVRKASYAFSWMGRPIIQLPEDMVRVQEAIWDIRPDVIIETGVAHGGSLVFYASLCKAMDHGRVIGIDIEIRPHNRAAIEAHPLFDRITLVEGGSTDPSIIQHVHGLVQPGETVMLLLDSKHTADHVLDELRAYAELVTPGSYVVVADGIMAHVAGMPRTGSDWDWNNPKTAISQFLEETDRFERVSPPRPFDESQSVPDCSHHPDGWLRRR